MNQMLRLEGTAQHVYINPPNHSSRSIFGYRPSPALNLFRKLVRPTRPQMSEVFSCSFQGVRRTNSLSSTPLHKHISFLGSNQCSSDYVSMHLMREEETCLFGQREQCDVRSSHGIAKVGNKHGVSASPWRNTIPTPLADSACLAVGIDPRNFR